MGRYILNSLTLKEVGIRLLPDENLEVAVELEGSLTEELEYSNATLLLTNKRVARYSVSGHKTSVVSAALDDVDSIEVNRTERNRQWIWVGLVFIGGGLLLALLSLILVSFPASPLLMAFSLFMIGVVFMLTYLGGGTGEVIVRAGMKDIKCKMRSKAVTDMTLFVQRAYELKLGYTNGVFDSLAEETPAEQEYLDAVAPEMVSTSSELEA